MSKKNIANALSETLAGVIDGKVEIMPESAIQTMERGMPKELGIGEKIVQDTESDVEYARAQLKSLIDANNEAISTMSQLAGDSEHPRAFEVLTGLIKQAADMNKQLVGLQKQRKDIVIHKDTKDEGASTVTNNALFVGTTADLQQIIKKTMNPVIENA